MAHGHRMSRLVGREIGLVSRRHNQSADLLGKAVLAVLFSFWAALGGVANCKEKR